MPQLSAEVRWFLPSTETERRTAFGAWFEAGAFALGGKLSTPRDDVYLREANIELGIKDRGGKPGLEVKALVGEAGEVRLAGGGATVQIWTKVTSKVLALPTDRLLVRKWRRLRKFDCADAVREVELGGGASGEEPKEGSWPTSGCNVEWTRIDVNGTEWWSFGMEAFAADGDPNSLVQSLKRTVEALEKRGTPPKLDGSWIESSYPKWMATHYPTPPR